MEAYSDEVIGFCNYCHTEILRWEKWIIRDGKLYHDDKANNCNNQSQLFIDEWGDNVFEEEEWEK